MTLRTVFAICLLGLFCVPTPSDASHTRASSTSEGKNDIAIPVLFGVTRGDITPDFGDPRGGGTRSHEGQDIMAPQGTPIVSPVRGTIAGLGSAPTPGKYVYVRGSDGYTYAFMHLDELAKVKRGQKVKVGDLLGTVGETGNARGTTPHLHFEIRKGKPIDPYPRLTKEFTLEEKIKYLNAALGDFKKSSELVDFMVERYSGTLLLAEREGIELNKKFVTALKKQGTLSVASTTLGLRSGSEGEAVRVLQVALIRANMGKDATRLGVAGATGYFGSLTERALREFQRAYGIREDGTFTLETRTALARGVLGEVKGVSTTTVPDNPSLALLIPRDLGVGEEGVDVMLLQAFLMKEGDGSASRRLIEEGATGYFGTLTESALREYQRKMGVPESGMFDVMTRTRIMNITQSAL